MVALARQLEALTQQCLQHNTALVYECTYSICIMAIRLASLFTSGQIPMQSLIETFFDLGYNVWLTSPL